jgi:hypothetical protein
METHRRNQTISPLLIRRTLPPHRSTKPQLPHQLRLPRHHRRRIITHHGALSRIVAPARDDLHVLAHLCARRRERLVVVDTRFPGARADAGERRPRPAGVGEGAAVEGHAEDDFG